MYVISILSILVLACLAGRAARRSAVGPARNGLAAALALSTLALIPGTAALAAGPSSVPFATLWVVEPQAPQVEATLVPKGGTITRARLLPLRLVSPEREIRSQAGIPLAPAGAQMIALSSRIGIYCVADPPTRWGGFSNRKFPCFVDSDGDGRVESYFSKQSAHQNMFLIQGKLPADREPVAPTRVVDIPPADLKNGPLILVCFDGIGDWTKTLRIFSYVGSDTEHTVFGPNHDIKLNTLPATLELFGGRIEILSTAGTAATFRVSKSFPPQPALFY